MNKQQRAEQEKDFIRMIHENERIIYKVCSLYVSGDFPMEDLYQEVVINLWKAFPRFRNESSYSTYVYRVALNTCISGMRRESRRGQKVPLVFAEETAFEPDNLEENLREMYRLIRQLKKLDRSLILLWLEERPYQEIAEITGLSLCNVATKLKRIKEKLIKMSNQ
ncbi:MAG: sigma-70 family RNA polymerase sigma factor [Prevotellaceae bacterium]|jgi:RNA polymerase sigma-70 factor (ECF subfamily)|nr:sigma-70 family RNA polymerase sigma factor [Prevotellaceae bacterium]